MSNNAFSRGLTYVESAGFNTTTTLLNTATAGTGAEGSWTELIASTAADSDHITVYASYATVGAGAGVEEFSIDIGVGAAASEQVLIENMPMSGRVLNSETIDIMSFPIQIPASTRVAARVAADSALNAGVAIVLHKGGEKSSSFSGAKGYGITAAFGGTAVDPGGAANTKGSWTELVASTGETIRGFWIHIGLNENLTVGVVSSTFTDIGIGAAASEQVIVPNHYTMTGTSENGIRSVFYDIEIPAGTRIAARSQCTDTDATDRIRTVALVGLI